MKERILMVVLCVVMAVSLIQPTGIKANLQGLNKNQTGGNEMTQTYKVQVSMNQAHLVDSGFTWKQGDFGFNIEIEVLDFDTSGATPSLVFRKGDGAVEATTGISVSNNKYTYTIRGTELETPGPCICDIKLKNSTTQRISTASFKYFVLPDTEDGLNQETSSYSDTIAQVVSNLMSVVGDLKSTLIYPYGAIDEISGIKSLPFGRGNWNLTTGEAWPENLNYKFIDELIVPSSTLYICCTNDNFNMFYLKYQKDGTYVGWSFVETTFGTHHAFLSGDYNYRIAITQKNNTLPQPTLADSKYVLIWEIPEEEYADLYKPQTYLIDRSIARKKNLLIDGELDLTWIKENRRLGDGTIIENPSSHNMITSIEMIDCTSNSLFIVNDSIGDLFLIKYNSDGTYNSWTAASSLFGGKQYGWLPQGYKYYPLVTTGDISQQFNIRVFSSAKNNIYVPNDMAKIQAACDFAKNGDNIYIANGTYLEDVSVYTKNVNLIGESRDYTIIKTTTDKYSQPPLEIAVGSVKNITFYSDDSNRASGESEDHAYAVHVDYPQLIDNTIIFENCKFYSKNTSAFGCGLRNNSKILLIECELISQNSFGIFAHTQTNPEQIGTEQYIELNKCKVESKTWQYAVSLMSCLGEGNDGKYISYNCIYKANGIAPTDYDRKTYQNTGGTFTIDEFSFGNNVSHMNGNNHN